MPERTTAPPPSPMSQGRYRLLLGGLLVRGRRRGLSVGIAGHRHRPTRTTARSRTIVERFIPKPNDEVLRQAELGIDLAPGYDGTLAVNGVDIPVEEQRRVPEQNEVFFTPGEGKAVEQLAGRPELRDRHRVEGRRRPGHRRTTSTFTLVLRGDVSRGR